MTRFRNCYGRDPEYISNVAVMCLGITQIIGYGTLYYSFGILAPAMAHDFGLSVEWMFGALSVALLVGGLSSPWLGQLIDRFGAGRIMTAGSFAAAAALIAGALSPGRSFFIVALIGIEVAANFVLYGAAFSLLVQIHAIKAQRNITFLTLMAGFASTIFWPLTTSLSAHFSWQQIYLIFAALNFFICCPIHFALARMAQRERAKEDGLPEVSVPGSLVEDARPAGFVLMVSGLCLLSLMSAAILVHMVPMLSDLGLGSMAALVGSLFGPAQVCSRFANMAIRRDISPLLLAILAAVLMAGSVGVLGLTAPSPVGAMTFAVLFGCGNGLFSVIAGTLPLALFGSEGYGRRQGRIMSARLIVSAMAPFAFALLLGIVGPSTTLAITASLGGAAAFSFFHITRVGVKGVG
ncbi:arsenite efflux MFS transporter ArsK [Agrobacterium vitis]